MRDSVNSYHVRRSRHEQQLIRRAYAKLQGPELTEHAETPTYDDRFWGAPDITFETQYDLVDHIAQHHAGGRKERT